MKLSKNALNLIGSPQMTVEITDDREYNGKGKYHGQTVSFANVDGGLFMKYGQMKEWEKLELNHTFAPGRVCIWGKVTGAPDDIRLGVLKFQYCLSQIGMEMDFENLKFINLLKKK